MSYCPVGDAAAVLCRVRQRRSRLSDAKESPWLIKPAGRPAGTRRRPSYAAVIRIRAAAKPAILVTYDNAAAAGRHACCFSVVHPTPPFQLLPSLVLSWHVSWRQFCSTAPARPPAARRMADSPSTSPSFQLGAIRCMQCEFVHLWLRSSS